MGSVTRSVRGASWWQENLSGKPCQETSPVLTIQVLKMQEVMLVLVAAALGKSLDIGRSGVSGLKALQEHGLVQLDLERDHVEEMQLSMKNYYKEVMTDTITEPSKQYRRLPLSKEKVMVK